MVVDALQKLQAQRQPLGFRRHRLTGQRIGDPLPGGCQRLCQRAVKPPGDAHRQHEAVNQSGAQDTDGDLFHPNDREVKDGPGHGDGGETNQARGVARQQKSVSARRALKQRQTQATRDPQAQHGATQDRLVNEGGHDEDGGRRADEGPEQAIDAAA